MRPSFARRVTALVVDYGLVLGWMAVVASCALISWLVTGRLADWQEFGVGGAQALGFVVLVVPVGIYLFACEASRTQATLGKRVMRLRVIDERSGGRPAPWRILLRTVVKLAPWEFAHFVVWQVVAEATGESSVFPVWLIVGLLLANVIPVVYVVVVALQRERRGPHDLAAGTRVIRID